MRNFLFHLILFFVSIAACVGSAFVERPAYIPPVSPETTLSRSAGWTPFHFPASDGLDRTGETLGTLADVSHTGSQEHHPSSRSPRGMRHIENRLIRALSGYILFARTIVPGLPVSRIIFPFHVFG